METDTQGVKSSAQPVAFTLHEVLFADRFLSVEEEEQLPEFAGFGFSLALDRPSPRRLVVALTFSVDEELPYDLGVTYAAHFEMDESVPEESREEEWKDVAYRTAPALIYPYIRELVSNLTSRWYDPALVLPHVVDLDFSSEGIEIPPPRSEPDHSDDVKAITDENG